MPQSGKQPKTERRASLNSEQQNYQKQLFRGQAKMSSSDQDLYQSEEHSHAHRRQGAYNHSNERSRAASEVANYGKSSSSPHPYVKGQGGRLPKNQKNFLSFCILYALRLLIMGVGISAIAGTVLSSLNPTIRIPSKGVQVVNMQATPQKQASVVVATAGALKLSQEIMPLKTLVQQLAGKNTKLLPGVFFVDLDTGAYIDLNGELTFSAASMIKFPILVAFFQDVDEGKIHLDEPLTLKKELIGGGSGDMQYQPVGTKFTALSTATKMITISDNTATNMLISRLGGATALNQRFQSWGLTVTEIRNPLPDLSGTNTTSPRDLAQLMAAVQQGDLILPKSRDRLLHIMRQTVTATLLPKGLGKGATIAHKTGDIGSMVGDVGLVDMPSGKRYIAVAMVKRPYNNEQAKELIRSFSRAAYQQFSQSAATPLITTTPLKRAGEAGVAGGAGGAGGER